MADPITIENLGKTYPGGNQALREVSLDVDPGSFLVLLGPSGGRPPWPESTLSLRRRTDAVSCRQNTLCPAVCR